MIHLPHLWTPTKRQLVVALYALGFVLYGVVFFLGLNQLAETRRISAKTNVIAGQLQEVLCKDIPAKDCNFSKVVNEVEADHKRQDNYWSCVLTALGNPELAPVSDISTQCEKATSSASGNTSGTNSSSSGDAQVGPSSQSTPTPTPSQPNNSQEKPTGPDCTIDIIFLHALRCK